jgi:hypothetical protein
VLRPNSDAAQGCASTGNAMPSTSPSMPSSCYVKGPTATVPQMHAAHDANPLQKAHEIVIDPFNDLARQVRATPHIFNRKSIGQTAPLHAQPQAQPIEAYLDGLASPAQPTPRHKVNTLLQDVVEERAQIPLQAKHLHGNQSKDSMIGDRNDERANRNSPSANDYNHENMRKLERMFVEMGVFRDDEHANALDAPTSADLSNSFLMSPSSINCATSHVMLPAMSIQEMSRSKDDPTFPSSKSELKDQQKGHRIQQVQASATNPLSLTTAELESLQVELAQVRSDRVANNLAAETKLGEALNRIVSRVASIQRHFASSANELQNARNDRDRESHNQKHIESYAQKCKDLVERLTAKEDSLAKLRLDLEVEKSSSAYWSQKAQELKKGYATPSYVISRCMLTGLMLVDLTHQGESLSSRPKTSNSPPKPTNYANKLVC